MQESHKLFLMAATNTVISEDTLFRTIAHPARRHILTLLAASDQSVRDLTSCFDMSQPAISQHLRELREANLVSSRKVGSEQHYHLTGAPLKLVYDWCAQYRRFFDPTGHAWAFASTMIDTTQPAKKRTKHGR